MRIEELLDRFDGVRSCGDSDWKCLCPGHQDQDESLHISIGETGKAVVHCFSGCKSEDVLGTVGLSFKDLNLEGITSGPRSSVGRELPSSSPLRDEVYRKFLDLLTLSTEDYCELLQRGLPDESIQKGTYRSLSVIGVGRAIPELRETFGPDLHTVPGFRESGGRTEVVLKEGMLIPVLSVNGQIKGLQVRTSEGPSKYTWFSGKKSPSGGSPVHVRRTLDQSMTEVVLTEGPLKADIIYHHLSTVPVVGLPGVSSWKRFLDLVKVCKVRHVRLAWDMDWTYKSAVRKQLLACANSLVKAGCQLSLLTWEKGKGLDDLLASGGIYQTTSGNPDVLREIRTGVSTEKAIGYEEVSLEEHPEADLLNMADVEEEPIEWLWKGWIARGTLSLLDGDPGLGKSTILLDLTARITRGYLPPPSPPMVDTSELPGNVLILSGEDDPARIIKPRLLAAGAEVSRVDVLRGFFNEDQKRELVSLPNHFDRLEALVQSGRYSLVIIDPLFAYLDEKVNSYRDQDIRTVTARLSEMAEVSQTAILLVRHLNKSPGGQALYRGGGSIGIIGAARTALLGAKHPEDPEKRVVLVQKSNLGRPPKALVYRFEETDRENIARIEWEGESDLTADKLLGASKEEKRGPTLEKAVCFLERQLSKGPQLVKDLVRKANVQNMSCRTLYRARDEMGNIETDSTRSAWRLKEGNKERHNSDNSG